MFLILFSSAYADLSEVLVSRGYLELRTTYFDQGETRWQSIERFRPTLRIHPHDRITVHGTLDISFTQGRYDTEEVFAILRDPIEAALPPQFDGTQFTLENVIEDCNWNLDLERTYDETSDWMRLARLYLDVHLPWLDMRIGKQAINWGSAQFFNPTDILAENLLQEPWQERTGVYAIRSNIPLPRDGLVTAVLALNQEQNGAQFGIKGGFNLWSTDIYAMAYSDGSAAVLGWDFKGDLVVGWWVEGAYVSSISEFQNGHVQLSAGVDYSFDLLDQFTLSAQLSHDGSGNIPELYDWSSRWGSFSLNSCPEYGLSLPPSPEEERQTLGRWYALSTQRLFFLNDWSFSHLLLFNLADGTGLTFPSFTYQNDLFSLNIGAQVTVGEDGEFSPPSTQTDIMGTDISPLIPNWTVLSWARWNY